MTANMKMMMHNTKVKLPKAPIVRPIIEISKFNVGHDLANLNTLSWKKRMRNLIFELAPRTNMAYDTTVLQY